jgi:hypothetical protein
MKGHIAVGTIVTFVDSDGTEYNASLRDWQSCGTYWTGDLWVPVPAGDEVHRVRMRVPFDPAGGRDSWRWLQRAAPEQPESGVPGVAE